MEEKEILERIKTSKKLPQEVKNKIVSKIFECFFSAIIVYVYFIFLKLGEKNIHQNIFLTDLKVFQVSLVIIAIVFFEKAYNKNNIKSLCIGIEILVLAIITMLVQYIVLYLTHKYVIIIPLFAIMYNIYYILKALVLIHIVKNEYKSSLSDIKEIVKKQPKNET